ncbi:CoA transferase [Sinimarinibacterium thermocellulolyticum]|uniref:CoA transferase n=1 Tax=Sinimarinibacterium thermocellulolyticum TaxID=3170016 RepID=A0ABV2A6I6_9GAMM
MVAPQAEVEHTASRYAAALLRALGRADVAAAVAPRHPAVAAARCGLLALTGPSEAPPRLCPAPLAACADGALAALAALAPPRALDDLCGAALLTERAAIFGHARRGRVSPGGSARLLDTRDGAVALNLPRDDDWTLLPALLEREIALDWPALAAAVRDTTMHELVERGRELGLAIAPVVPAPLRRALLAVPARNEPADEVRRQRRQDSHPRVLDLSSLWAGPLCSHLLQRCGADVVKLESTRRPDGARNGPATFFDLLNAGKRSVALDFASDDGRARLRELISRADIVIEASRPRALRQLGIDAEAIVAKRPHLTWISLTGYGRGAPQEQWIAYGDDAGVAGGLAYLMRQVHGAPMFVGDAIADPLAGLHAALAAWAGWCAGGGGLVSIALVDVVRQIVGFEAPADAAGWRQRARDWADALGSDDIRAPQARRAAARAPALGADNARVFADWGIAC